MAPQLFVHIGDIHLAHGSARNADRLAALDQIVSENESCDFLSAWLIPGDVFDARSNIDDRNAFAERVARMAAVAPAVLVRGNHDAHGDLQIFSRLKARWPVYVVEQPGVIEVPLPRGAVAACACLPYPDRHGLVSAGVVKGDVAGVAAQLLDTILIQLAHDLHRAAAAGTIPVFLGHVNVRGSIVSTGQPQIGQEQEIDRASLDRLPALYRALNHIHAPQVVGAGVYAGSIAANSYGEIEAKSYVLVEVTRDLSASGWLATWRRQPLETPPMFHVEGQLTRDDFQMDPIEGVHYQAGAIDWTGADVRVRYRYLASERAVLNEQLIRDRFRNALRLKIEGVVVPDRDVRRPEVAAATTLAEKLAAYRGEPSLPSSVRVKLAQLELAVPTADALLEAVAGELHAIEFGERAEVAA